MPRLLTLCTLIFLCIPLHGQIISTNGIALVQTGGAPSSCLSNGFKTLSPANANGSCIDLTTGGNNFESSAVWACDPINLGQNFKISFTGNFGSTVGAGDGIAFVLQTEGVPQVKGGQGGGIGYSYGNGAACLSGTCPISPSVIIEFDTYDHSSAPLTPPINDIACSHMSIQKNGLMDAFNSSLSPLCLNGGGTVIDGLDHNICISWDRTLLELEVYFDGVSIGILNDNIAAPFSYFFNPASVYWGFTSAKGPAPQEQKICNVEMQTNIASPSCAIALPIGSISLVSSQEYDNYSSEPIVELSWTAISGNHVQLFELQKSIDGLNFETLGIINSTSIEKDQIYDFVDDSPAYGMNYYRVMSVDDQNKTIFSNINAVKIEDVLGSVHLFPNPVRDELTVGFDLLKKSKISILIYDALGQLIFDRTEVRSGGENRFVVNTSCYQPGIYYAVIKNYAGLFTERFAVE